MDAYNFKSTLPLRPNEGSTTRQPIYNPYDKFTKPEFDVWIDGITGALKHALGYEVDDEEEEEVPPVERGRYDHLVGGRLNEEDAAKGHEDEDRRLSEEAQSVDDDTGALVEALGSRWDAASPFGSGDEREVGEEEESEEDIDLDLRAVAAFRHQYRELPPHLRQHQHQPSNPPGPDTTDNSDADAEEEREVDVEEADVSAFANAEEEPAVENIYAEPDVDREEEGEDGPTLHDSISQKAKGKQRDPREGPGLSSDRRRLPPDYLPLSDEEIIEDESGASESTGNEEGEAGSGRDDDLEYEYETGEESGEEEGERTEDGEGEGEGMEYMIDGDEEYYTDATDAEVEGEHGYGYAQQQGGRDRVRERERNRMALVASGSGSASASASASDDDALALGSTVPQDLAMNADADMGMEEGVPPRHMRRIHFDPHAAAADRDEKENEYAEHIFQRLLESDAEYAPDQDQDQDADAEQVRDTYEAHSQISIASQPHLQPLVEAQMPLRARLEAQSRADESHRGSNDQHQDLAFPGDYKLVNGEWKERVHPDDYYGDSDEEGGGDGYGSDDYDSEEEGRQEQGAQGGLGFTVTGPGATQDDAIELLDSDEEEDTPFPSTVPPPPPLPQRRVDSYMPMSVDAWNPPLFPSPQVLGPTPGDRPLGSDFDPRDAGIHDDIGRGAEAGEKEGYAEDEEEKQNERDELDPEDIGEDRGEVNGEGDEEDVDMLAEVEPPSESMFVELLDSDEEREPEAVVEDEPAVPARNVPEVERVDAGDGDEPATVFGTAASADHEEHERHHLANPPWLESVEPLEELLTAVATAEPDPEIGVSNNAALADVLSGRNDDPVFDMPLAEAGDLQSFSLSDIPPEPILDTGDILPSESADSLSFPFDCFSPALDAPALSSNDDSQRLFSMPMTLPMAVPQEEEEELEQEEEVQDQEGERQEEQGMEMKIDPALTDVGADASAASAGFRSGFDLQYPEPSAVNGAAFGYPTATDAQLSITTEGSDLFPSLVQSDAFETTIPPFSPTVAESTPALDPGPAAAEPEAEAVEIDTNTDNDTVANAAPLPQTETTTMRTDFPLSFYQELRKLARLAEQGGYLGQPSLATETPEPIPSLVQTDSLETGVFDPPSTSEAVETETADVTNVDANATPPPQTEMTTTRTDYPLSFYQELRRLARLAEQGVDVGQAAILPALLPLHQNGILTPRTRAQDLTSAQATEVEESSAKELVVEDIITIPSDSDDEAEKPPEVSPMEIVAPEPEPATSIEPAEPSVDAGSEDVDVGASSPVQDLSRAQSPSEIDELDSESVVEAAQLIEENEGANVPALGTADEPIVIEFDGELLVEDANDEGAHALSPPAPEVDARSPAAPETVSKGDDQMDIPRIEVEEEEPIPSGATARPAAEAEPAISDPNSTLSVFDNILLQSQGSADEKEADLSNSSSNPESGPDQEDGEVQVAGAERELDRAEVVDAFYKDVVPDSRRSPPREVIDVDAVDVEEEEREEERDGAVPDGGDHTGVYEVESASDEEAREPVLNREQRSMSVTTTVGRATSPVEYTVEEFERESVKTVTGEFLDTIGKESLPSILKEESPALESVSAPADGTHPPATVVDDPVPPMSRLERDRSTSPARAGSVAEAAPKYFASHDWPVCSPPSMISELAPAGESTENVAVAETGVTLPASNLVEEFAPSSDVTGPAELNVMEDPIPAEEGASLVAVVLKESSRGSSPVFEKTAETATVTISATQGELDMTPKPLPHLNGEFQYSAVSTQALNGQHDVSSNLISLHNAVSSSMNTNADAQRATGSPGKETPGSFAFGGDYGTPPFATPTSLSPNKGASPTRSPAWSALGPNQWPEQVPSPPPMPHPNLVLDPALSSHIPSLSLTHHRKRTLGPQDWGPQDWPTDIQARPALDIATTAMPPPSADATAPISSPLTSPSTSSRSPKAMRTRFEEDDDVIVVRKRKRGEDSSPSSPALSRVKTLKGSASKQGGNGRIPPTPVPSPRVPKRAPVKAAPKPKALTKQKSKRQLGPVATKKRVGDDSESGSSSAASRLLQLSRASSVASTAPSEDAQPSPSLRRQLSQQKVNQQKGKASQVKRPPVLHLPTTGKHNHNHLLLRPKSEYETPRLELITPIATSPKPLPHREAPSPDRENVDHGSHAIDKRASTSVQRETKKTKGGDTMPTIAQAQPAGLLNNVATPTAAAASQAQTPLPTPNSHHAQHGNGAKSSPITRSQCRFHTVRWLYGETDPHWVHFVIPGCALGDMEVMQEIGVEDLGDASIEDHEQMVGELTVIEHVDGDLFGELRHLVGVDLLREEAVFYLPKPGDALEGKLRVTKGAKPSPLSNSLSQNNMAEAGPSHAGGSKPTNGSATNGHDAATHGSEPTGSILANHSPSGSTTRAKAMPPPISKLSISSMASVGPSVTFSNLRSDDEVGEPSVQRNGHTQKGPEASPVGSSPVDANERGKGGTLKPRRSKRLGVDNAEYRPSDESDGGVDTEVESPAAAIKSKPKKGLKRSRSSMVKDDAREAQSKRRKRSIVVDG